MGLNCRKKWFRTNLRKNFLTARTAGKWNVLPQEGVGSPSMEVFNKRLDRHPGQMRWKHKSPVFVHGFGLTDP